MRKWIVEETGEVRFPNRGETFLRANNIDIAYINCINVKYPILRVTEITDNDKIPSFDEWNW